MDGSDEQITNMLDGIQDTLTALQLAEKTIKELMEENAALKRQIEVFKEEYYIFPKGV